MTRTQAKPIFPSGHFEVRVLPDDSPAYRTALALILSGSPILNDKAIRQIESLQVLADRQQLRMDLLVAAYSPPSSELISAALAIESPGRTLMVHTRLGNLSQEERQALGDVLIELQRQAWQRGITLLQSLLLPGDRDRPVVYASAGFQYLAELIYMDRDVGLEARKFNSSLKLRILSYREDRRSLFLRALDESYVDSLDCPGLTGMRRTEDMLAGHVATGIYDPNGWFVAMVADEPVGVMLTSRVTDRSAIEVVYMGVSRHARGRGVSHRLMAQAVAHAESQRLGDVTLAVDSTNEPARRLYTRWGFTETSRRRAWIASSSNVASACR